MNPEEIVYLINSVGRKAFPIERDTVYNIIKNIHKITVKIY